MFRTALIGALLASSVAGCAPARASSDVRRPVDEPSPDDDEAVLPAPEGPIGASGNTRIRTFDAAKRELRRIYTDGRNTTDLYCGCTFFPHAGRGWTVDLGSCGYTVARDAARAGRIEWEHAVAAAAFGQGFPEWREGDPRCVDGKGKRFKGRKCARLASPEFARMEADLHNLFPVVGEVNGLRGDLPMGVMDPPQRAHHGADGTFRFGHCQSAIEAGVFMPRGEVRGDLARAAKYMDRAYPDRRLLDEAHRAVFDRWDAEDPPDTWERDRNERIAACQGNANGFITAARSSHPAAR